MFPNPIDHRTLASSLPFAMILSCAALLSLTPSASAQLQHVEQLVYGMDCKPCAVGVQRRMERLDGVKTVELRLNRGTATLELEPKNEVTLHAIRDSIRRGGFSPQHAFVKVAGVITLDDDGSRILTFGTNERYRLIAADETDEEAAEDDEQFEQWRESWRSIQQIEPDQRVLVTGRAPRSEQTDEPRVLPLHVREFNIVRDEDSEEGES